ncbi:murein hydrolase activator EnvC family protein [Agathobaculum sp.]|uniref:murein hydrolase activator EnvC family protein n=1 Tax=Agathobaculum sp. TaxID=2048138 RepID=UPI002A818D87|nr:peptidoglycan DD-metalloendopeptidase family protein [Agathobaculum sp.]MDY3618569.1 peptidoglycan DD-metalloendopeptidase family protein [Agathobaculum sp.]
MMSKKTVRVISAVIAAILVGAMVFGMLASGLSFAGAADADELKDKLSSLEDQKASVKAQIAELTEQAKDVEATRQALQSEIDLTKEEISTVEAYIERLQQQIDVKTAELEVAEQQLTEKEDEFALAVRTTYEQGDSTYLQILLNSSSFSNMLKRIEIVSQLLEHNKQVVAEFQAAKEDIEQKRNDLQDTQDEQVQYQENLGYKVDELAANEAQQAALQESLEAYKAESEAEYDRINSEMNSVSNEIAALSRQSAAAGGATLYSGTFTWPLPGYTSNSSAYGWRIHPIFGTRKFHSGEDIPAPTGASILAAASGTVVTAGWVSGYGNYTVIDHGGGYMTAYGHQSAIYVSVGQSVSAGETIGAVGSTGNSTGPHLHFEVYVNGATQNPMDYFS